MLIQAMYWLCYDMGRYSMDTVLANKQPVSLRGIGAWIAT